MKNLFKKRLLPFSVPEIDKNNIITIFKSIFFLKMRKGHEIGIFEKEFAKYIGVKYAICFSSARYSLYLLYKYFNCKDKDVLFPAYTCIPALDALRWAGANPRFLDVDLSTYNPRFEADLLNSKGIGAISLSFLYGLVGDIGEFLEFGKKNNIPVIEDAAIALGSSYKGRRIGTLGDAAVFSLQSSKILTSWKGGIITTNNEETYNYLCKERDKLPYPPVFKLLFNVFLTCFRRALSSPAVYGWTIYSMKRIAFSKFFNKAINYLINQNPNEAITGKSSKAVPRAEMARFTNLQAMVALASFKRIDSILNKRNHIADLYDNGLINSASVKIPIKEEGINHAYGRYPIRASGISKFYLKNLFFKYGVETSEYYPYICPDTYFMKGYNLKDDNFTNAKIASQETLLLPMHSFLKERDVLSIIRTCNNIMNNKLD